MDTLAEHAAKGWEVRSAHFPPLICFAYPLKTKTISVTGAACELNCAHCGGHYLKQMTPLAEAGGATKLGSSCLISGGCNSAGRVPVSDHLAALTSLKQGRRFNLHVGLVADDEIAGLAAIADQISFDFVGDDATVREVFGLDRTVEDYVRCYGRLKERCRVMPHICIGLHGGEIRGEYRALELLEQLGCEGLTFIIFTPTRGTRFADCQPPALEEAVKLLVEARRRFPAVPIHLGCMRPGGRYRSEIDQWAVRAGVNTIVNPVPAAVRLAENLGLTIVRGEECCAL
ncbi:MAG: radical SAM protein [Negativicutes bacterium]|nr:radical SAM protein [Negativicutes bacterium]